MPKAGELSSWLLEKDQVLEPFRPLEQSRIWDLNAAYWAKRGAAAFEEDCVPYLATSDGTLSKATADLMVFAHRSGMTFDAVVEFGPGLGLFARLLARRLSDAGLSPPAYLGIDVSPALLKCTKERLADAPLESVQTRVIDLARAAETLPGQVAEALPHAERILCIFNYVLDSLPQSQLRLKDGRLEHREIEMRSDGVAFDDCVPNRDLILRTRWAPTAKHSQIDISEGAPRTVAVGALQVLSQLHSCKEVQAVLINDYPVGERDHVAEPFERFGGSVAAGLDFTDFETQLSEAAWCVSTPDGAAHQITSRFLTRGTLGPLTASFSEHFSFEAASDAHRLSASARQYVHNGSNAAAMSAYLAALDAEPNSWSLKLEVAGFLARHMNRWDDTRRLVAMVLEDNPFSSEAMVLAGDCRMALDAPKKALGHYKTALAMSARKASIWLKCAQAHRALDRADETLAAISQGLTAEGDSAIMDRLLALQQEVSWEHRRAHG
ncbi:MAG: SAM-dependent methyltransferase [Pseudomonadota bacterium]